MKILLLALGGIFGYSYMCYQHSEKEVTLFQLYLIWQIMDISSNEEMSIYFV
jgi:hypothetical protein